MIFNGLGQVVCRVPFPALHASQSVSAGTKVYFNNVAGCDSLFTQLESRVEEFRLKV